MLPHFFYFLFSGGSLGRNQKEKKFFFCFPAKEPFALLCLFIHCKPNFRSEFTSLAGDLTTVLTILLRLVM
jgi:hypothetical protein